METKINHISKTQKEIEVILLPKEIREYFDQAANIISLERQIPGFRPGRVPPQIIIQNFGEEILWQKACNLAIENTWAIPIKENQFALVSTPKIQIAKIEIEKPLFYKILIEILPEIELPDYKKIAKEKNKERKEIEVKEREIEETLKFLQDSRAVLKRVNRGAKKGDEITLEIKSVLEKEKLKEKKPEKIKIVLGKDKSLEEFEEKLIGLKEGESKTFSIENKFLNSEGKMEKKAIIFEVKICSVMERTLPPIDDNFAKSLGNFSSLEDLKEKLKENIKAEKEEKEKERIRIKIISAILEETPIEIPPSLIEEELEEMIKEAEVSFSQRGVSFSEFLKNKGKSKDQLKEDWKDSAQKRVATRLVLREIAKKEKIQVKEEEVIERANYYLNRYHVPLSELPQPEELKNYIREVLLNEKVLHFLETL